MSVTVYEFLPGEIDKLKSLAEWAYKPGNEWRPGHPPPGSLEDRRRLLKANEQREGQPRRAVIVTVVFTVTQQPFGLCRHASISLSSLGNIAMEAPTPNTMGVLCKMLGFVGDWNSWIVQPHPSSGAVGIVEPIAKQ